MMHPTTFEYLKPTDDQLENMANMRAAFQKLASYVDSYLHDGEDKDHVMRLVRDAAMWANVAITREADGKPRT